MLLLEQDPIIIHNTWTTQGSLLTNGTTMYRGDMFAAEIYALRNRWRSCNTLIRKTTFSKVEAEHLFDFRK
jgi:hypothetical protein